MPRWTIVGLNKQTLGHVHGKNKGAALQAAVDNGLVTGKKKIGSAVALPEDDPYEQSFEDIYGAPAKRESRRAVVPDA